MVKWSLSFSFSTVQPAFLSAGTRTRLAASRRAPGGPRSGDTAPGRDPRRRPARRDQVRCDVRRGVEVLRRGGVHRSGSAPPGGRRVGVGQGDGGARTPPAATPSQFGEPEGRGPWLNRRSGFAAAGNVGTPATTTRAAGGTRRRSIPKGSRPLLTTVKMSRITGSYVDPNRSRVTLGSWADDWLAAKADLSPTTRNRYEGIIATHVRPRWGRVKLSDVTQAEVQRSITGLRLSPGSVRKVHRVLSMVLTR